MNKFVFVIILMFVAGCKSRTINSTTKSGIAKGNYAKEDFDQFFKKFKIDSVFQLERIKFPLTLVLTNENGNTIKAITKDAWRFDTFYYEKGYASRTLDAYTQDIKVYGDSVKIEQRGVDNGLQVDYKFVRESGKWFLQSGKDLSD